MPALRPRAPRPLRRLALTGVALVVVATGLLVAGGRPASAVVTPLHGYRATVAGFTSWYGSYGMAGLGTAWCIDHGIRAPDPAFAYRQADLSSVSVRTRVAMAWGLARYGPGTDRARHAAVMLVLHDLMGARYPRGELDVDHLAVRDLAGFAGQEARVLTLARAMKADGLRHAHLRGPIRLRVDARAPDAAGTVTITVRTVDAAGQAVAGLPVTVEVSAGTTLSARTLTTGRDGRARTLARPVRLPLAVRANVLAPTLALDAWAPTTRRAQRVARPAVRPLAATTSVAIPPATTTTTLPPTTTTVPSTTTTTTVVPTTTTTLPPTTTTLAPTTTTVAVVAPPATTTTLPPTTVPPPPPTTAPPVTVLSAPPTAPSLPRTGVDSVGLALLAAGLVLLGFAALDARRQRVSRLVAIGHHGGDGGIRPR